MNKLLHLDSSYKKPLDDDGPIKLITSRCKITNENQWEVIRGFYFCVSPTIGRL